MLIKQVNLDFFIRICKHSSIRNKSFLFKQTEGKLNFRIQPTVNFILYLFLVMDIFSRRHLINNAQGEFFNQV